MELLYTPIKICKTELSNRLVMPPMATAKADNGAVSQDMVDYYGQRANGSGVGLIITEHSYVNLQGRANRGQMSMSDDADISGLSRLTGRIHQAGVKVFSQISHAGSAAFQENPDLPVVGPSASPHPGRKNAVSLPKELTISELETVRKSFVDAATRVKNAGFDGVEIHAAHGYLLNQFYSPLTNRRTDAYGVQSVENRIRLTAEIVKEVRNAVGKDYPIAVRLGGCDYLEGGSTVEDCVEACSILAGAGVDLLDISGGMLAYTRPGHKEPGYFRDMAEQVKKAVSVPVLLTGGVTTHADAEKLLQENAADLIGVGRAILKNPNWSQTA